MSGSGFTPIDYRYRPPEQRFKKYQWIELDLGPSGAGNDHRAESRRPDLDTIKLIGARLPSERNWIERRAIIDKMPVHTLNELRTQHEVDKAANRSPVSLGIVRPKRVVDVVVEPVEGDWKELEKLGSAEKAAESVRKKCLQMVADDRDARFFVGTVFPYNTWIVLGVFWPAKEPQGRLGAW